MGLDITTLLWPLTVFYYAKNSLKPFAQGVYYFKVDKSQKLYIRVFGIKYTISMDFNRLLAGLLFVFVLSAFASGVAGVVETPTLSDNSVLDSAFKESLGVRSVSLNETAFLIDSKKTTGFRPLSRQTQYFLYGKYVAPQAYALQVSAKTGGIESTPNLFAELTKSITGYTPQGFDSFDAISVFLDAQAGLLTRYYVESQSGLIFTRKDQRTATGAKQVGNTLFTLSVNTSVEQVRSQGKAVIELREGSNEASALVSALASLGNEIALRKEKGFGVSEAEEKLNNALKLFEEGNYEKAKLASREASQKLSAAVLAEKTTEQLDEPKIETGFATASQSDYLIGGVAVLILLVFLAYAFFWRGGNEGEEESE